MPFRDQRLATAYRIALRACGFAAPPKRGCIAWPFERTAGASVTHCFGPHDHVSCDGRDAQRPGLRCRQHQPASRATVPGALGLRPARQSAPFTWSFGNSCQPAGALATVGARCTMKPWLNVSEAAAHASVSRDTIYTACERGELRSARVSGRRAIRIRPAWIDAWLERHAPDVQDRRRIGDAQNGAAS